MSALESTDLKEIRAVLFLCSGNMIRSAFCELYARHLDCRFDARSAGTTYHNDALHPETRIALEQRGVAQGLIESFRPTHVSELASFPQDEIVFGMTRDHLIEFRERTGSRQEGHLLGVLATGGEIADPLFEGGYERTFDMLERCVRKLVTSTAD